jgi:hypothetical protein
MDREATGYGSLATEILDYKSLQTTGHTGYSGGLTSYAR